MVESQKGVHFGSNLQKMGAKSHPEHLLFTLESGIDVGQGITVGPGKFVKIINVGPWINVGHEQDVQIDVTKTQSNFKISVDPGKNSKI